MSKRTYYIIDGMIKGEPCISKGKTDRRIELVDLMRIAIDTGYDSGARGYLYSDEARWELDYQRLADEEVPDESVSN